jgi:hypothetical protein
MQAGSAVTEVRETLRRFQDGYTARDLSALDEFVDLFAPGEDGELIGIGASVRGGAEWFQGCEQIREIIESDWTYWGDVRIDVEGARITTCGDVAWLSTSGKLIQTQTFDKALVFYVGQMKAVLDDEDVGLVERLMEATHFGMRRLRERHKGEGHGWPFVFTAVLVCSEGSWRFHTIHWSMPVD